MLNVDEAWLREYCRRTGKPMPKEAALACRMSTDTAQSRSSKYGNIRTEVNGERFDSRHEADVYNALMLMKRIGEIEDVIRQVPFELPGGIRYIADFVVIHTDRAVTVIDAKSKITAKNAVYRLKKRLMMFAYGTEIREV